MEMQSLFVNILEPICYICDFMQFALILDDLLLCNIIILLLTDNNNSNTFK